ncbi:hypothetical protein HUT15_36830 (plasmid) [Streptomyces sp. NA03103]|uniref:hypothetical protein n=1 Tax=Streptomyces sp. NA03103 TaxID=2742134 RepID=UPI001592A579|nr:hypothetical protein [Streptomyces sp. NA03103]QKW66093.1 hypothetical protein HUT15_36830 [Streptomyces sp. NA03103]
MAFFIDPQMDALHTAQEFVQRWAEAVLRQAARTREARKKVAADERAYDRGEDPGLDNWTLGANQRELWTEEHMLVWSAHQLERWRARLAKEREEPAPPENEALKDARDALEHLDEAVLGLDSATPPEGGKRKQQGRALRKLPEQTMSLSIGGDKIFEVLDPEVIDREALAVVASIEAELNDWATDHYAELMLDEQEDDR